MLSFVADNCVLDRLYRVGARDLQNYFPRDKISWPNCSESFHVIITKNRLQSVTSYALRYRKLAESRVA